MELISELGQRKKKKKKLLHLFRMMENHPNL